MGGLIKRGYLWLPSKWILTWYEQFRYFQLRRTIQYIYGCQIKNDTVLRSVSLLWTISIHSLIQASIQDVVVLIIPFALFERTKPLFTGIQVSEITTLLSVQGTFPSEFRFICTAQTWRVLSFTSAFCSISFLGEFLALVINDRDDGGSTKRRWGGQVHVEGGTNNFLSRGHWHSYPISSW